MPIYEYVCESCQAAFEHLQRSMTDGPKPTCPECESKKTRKQLSVFAVAADAEKSNPVSEGPGSCGRCGGAPGSCRM